MLSEGEFDDTEILNLQERANRLLLQEYDKLTVMDEDELLDFSPFDSVFFLTF